jgi:hypothetical protein
MRPTVWLASYPKSGNTWFRILLANLLPDRTTPAAINQIDSSESIASARPRFEGHVLVESGLLTHDEIDDLRPAFYRHLASDRYEDPFNPETAYPVRFVKTHDGYTQTRAGEPMMGGGAAAAGALLFVRDPRDVAPSFANHNSCSIDSMIGTMADPLYSFCVPPRGQVVQLRQRLLGWSGFAASWLDQTDVPVHVVRYEDLHRTPLATIRAALDFAGWVTNDAAIERAIRFARIDDMQRQEREGGFQEAAIGKDAAVRFFRRGVAEGWRDELTIEQVRRIERDHAAMMERLGYRPAMREELDYVDQQAG